MKTEAMPALKTLGGPRRSRDLKEAIMILEAYDEHKRVVVNLERMINAKLRVRISHNKIHEVLRMNGKATPQSTK